MSDEDLMIRIQASLAGNSTYRLVIAPHTEDPRGIPLARTYSYGFVGVALPLNPTRGISIVFIIVTLADLAGMTEGLVLVSILLVRNRKKRRRPQAVIEARVIRIHKICLSAFSTWGTRRCSDWQPGPVRGSDPAEDTPLQGRSAALIDSSRPPERAWPAARFEQDSAVTRAESCVIGFRR